MFKPKENLENLNQLELLKHFNSLFDLLALKHSYYNAFDNILDCCINAFCFNYNKDIMDRIRSTYTQDERYMIGEMLQIWIFYMNNAVKTDNSFYDFFGNFYEDKSMSKTTGFAQYFTPESICHLMAMVVVTTDIKNSVYEPTCGSGRLNLAMHATNNKLFHYGNDLDITCAKMATLNFLIHGIKGVVTCDDALWPKNAFKGAFIINYKTAPYIEYIDNADDAYYILNNILPENNATKFEVDFNKSDKSHKQIIVATSLTDVGKQLELF